MIDFQQILDAARDDALQSIYNGRLLDHVDENANVMKAQMKFALSLLEQYHLALQKALLEYDIQI